MNFYQHDITKARALSIGELSARTDIPVANIRYYEDAGVLPKPKRLNGRHRSYEEADVRRLNFVRSSRALGFSVNEVKELLRLSDPANPQCKDARDLAQRQIEQVRQRIRDLRKMELELSRIVAFCDANCACGRVPDCPVLSA